MTLKIVQPDSCDDCGLCCVGIGSPVLLYQSQPHVEGPHPHRPDGLPVELIEEIDEHFLGLARGQEPQEECLWYDAQAKCCRHYEWRPQICRNYELGGTACLLRRQEDWEGEAPAEPNRGDQQTSTSSSTMRRSTPAGS